MENKWPYAYKTQSEFVNIISCTLSTFRSPVCTLYERAHKSLGDRLPSGFGSIVNAFADVLKR